MSEYEYIRFERLESKGKTGRWVCRNIKSDGPLGVVKWHCPWRRYCYFPTCAAVYSAGCLADIQHFLEQAMEERKARSSKG